MGDVYQKPRTKRGKNLGGGRSIILGIFTPKIGEMIGSVQPPTRHLNCGNSQQRIRVLEKRFAVHWLTVFGSPQISAPQPRKFFPEATIKTGLLKEMYRDLQGFTASFLVRLGDFPHFSVVFCWFLCNRIQSFRDDFYSSFQLSSTTTWHLTAGRWKT